MRKRNRCEVELAYRRKYRIESERFGGWARRVGRSESIETFCGSTDSGLSTISALAGKR